MMTMQSGKSVGPQAIGTQVDSVLTETSTPSGTRAILPFYRSAADPPLYHPEKARSRDEIEPELRGLINGLVTGKLNWPLMVYGGVGSGKTCAALALADAAGRGCLVQTLAELTETVAACGRGDHYDPSGLKMNAERWWGEWWSKAPLVVIDELGLRGVVTDFQYEVLKRALDLRHGQPAVYVSNLSPRDLAGVYDDRIVSRLCEGTVHKLTSTDRRLNK